MTEAELAALRRRAIGRAIDEETERRLSRAGHHRPEPRREPEPVLPAAQRPPAATTMNAEASASWNAWARAAIDRRFEDIYLPAIAAALGKKGNELRDEFEPAIIAAKADVAEQLQQQIAGAVRDFTTGALAPLRAELEEVKGRLAEAEARLAAATAGPRAAALALPGRWIGTA